MEKIFLVEDDENFGSVLSAYLEMNDFEVEWIMDGKDAMAAFAPASFDICVLDVMLPNIDGFEIARRIRDQDSKVPLIFLTAKTMKQDMVTGFEIGADDYITKPFDSDVLLYKIRAILKREGAPKEERKDSGIYQVGEYQFNYHLRTISRNGKDQKLSPKEAALLKMLVEHQNEVLSRSQALKAIWGDDNYFTTRSMDVYITKLRKYLKSDTRIQIENIHGSGYRLLIHE